LREASRDLRKSQEARSQLDMALAASRQEYEGLRRGFESQQAQLQAAHEELSSLKEANRQLTDKLARTGPPLAADERPTLETLTSQNTTRAQEINELKAAQKADRAQIDELLSQLRTRLSGLSPDQVRALIGLVEKLVVRGGAWVARYAFCREYLAKEAFIRHLLVWPASIPRWPPVDVSRRWKSSWPTSQPST
jgi:DNA repair exonuclease SbcCD ATPase subunit